MLMLREHIVVKKKISLLKKEAINNGDLAENDSLYVLLKVTWLVFLI